MAGYIAEVERELRSTVERGEEIAQIPISGLSSTSAVLAEMLPEFPEFPLAALIPAPRELVRISFDLAESLLESQRRYAEGLVEGLAPITDKLMPWTIESKPTRTRTKRSESAAEQAA